MYGLSAAIVLLDVNLNAKCAIVAPTSCHSRHLPMIYLAKPCTYYTNFLIFVKRLPFFR